MFGIDIENCPNCGAGELKIIAAILEDRRHWSLPGTGALVEAESWVEQAAPDASSWAVFNRPEAAVQFEARCRTRTRDCVGAV